ncbi:hypothetical protein SBM1_00143 [Synechococcus phage S-BM1]|nr:hypothetical protein SBM1_00143 [Synechococcus phage S-BM1]
MATVQKSTKINFYKFVAIKDVSPSVKGVDAASLETAQAINTNTKALNNIGNVLNGVAKVSQDLKQVMLGQLTERQRRNTTFEAQYTKPQKEKKMGGFVAGIAGKSVSFLEGLLKTFSGLFKLLLVGPALKWLSDPKNQETIQTVLKVIRSVVTFIFDWAKFGITNTIDGLYNLLRDDASWWDRIVGLGQAIAGIGAIVLGVRYLRNPGKIVKDITNGVRALVRFVTGGGRRGTPNTGRGRGRMGGAMRLIGGLAVTGGAAYAINQMNQPEPEEKAQGGPIKKASLGGWISGPQSGYKVSLDGGRSTSFIGHGTEYVARKSNGGAFVVPFNTPGTKTQPHLTQKRISEAKSQGYKLPGFSQGGAFLEELKKRDATKGDNANKKIYLHWSAGALNNTALNGNLGYQAYVKTNGVHMHNKYGQTPPYHTWNKNGSNAAGIGIAGGAGITRERQAAWTSSNAPQMSQYKRMAKEAAGLATIWGWKPSDITDKRVRTHSEEYRDNKAGYGSHFRWDLEKLFGQDPLGSGPGKIRNMIKQEMAKFGQKNLNQTDNHDDSTMPKSGWNPLLGIADALTGNMFNFDGVPKTGSSSSAGSATRDTSSTETQSAAPGKGYGYGALLDLIGKRESDSSGGYDAVNQIGTNEGHGVEGYSGPFSEMSQHGGKKLTSLTVKQVMDLQSGWASSMSNAEWIRKGKLHAVGRYQFVGPTLAGLVSQGHAKPSDKFDQSTQNKLAVALIKQVGTNPSRLKGTWVGLSHETDAAIRAAVGKGGDSTGGTNGGGISSNSGSDVSHSSSSSSSDSGSGKPKKSFTIGEVLGGRTITPEIKERYSTLGINSHDDNSSRSSSSNSILKATEQRNKARQTANEKSSQMVRATMDAIQAANLNSQNIIVQSQQGIQQAMQMNQTPQPKLITSGGGSRMVKSVVSSLASSINPMSGIFK